MPVTRRQFVQLTAGALASRLTAPAQTSQPQASLLRSSRYDQVAILGGIPLAQQQNAQAILATFDDDALLKPFRVMGDQPAPGRDLGGWYGYLPDYNWRTGDAGLAPGHCFGQWTSAMARFAAAQNDAAARSRILRLHQRFADCISPDFFDKTRYPAYTLDKFNIGLLDAHTLLGDPNALAIADKARQCALPSLPGSAYERDIAWRKGRDFSFSWDESYTLPENLYRLYQAGAGDQYRTMAQAYLMETFFGPLARNQNILGNLHGYSHMNALGTAMQAYFVDGSQAHLQAALNAYNMVEAQTFATGGWAPDELFTKPGTGKLLASLTDSHNTFETPCCTYAYLKLSRYLLQLTRDGRFGDGMERVLFNSMFGALPLQPDGRTFYYADFNQKAQRVYSVHRWPCCAGTYTQVAADYGINTYLLDPEPGDGGLWVNLYLPSAISWQAGSTQLRLTLSGDYPLTGQITLRLEADRPTRFPLRLRIPAWCAAPSLHINGQAHPLHVQRGFATVNRQWRDGDELRLTLPATLRLEPFPADGTAHPPRLAAVCWGPLVLLPDRFTTLDRAALAGLRRVDERTWRTDSDASSLTFRPFFALGDAPYATYLGIAEDAWPPTPHHASLLRN